MCPDLVQREKNPAVPDNIPRRIRRPPAMNRRWLSPYGITLTCQQCVKYHAAEPRRTSCRLFSKAPSGATTHYSIDPASSGRGVLAQGLAAQPPNRPRNPTKSANKSADRFFTKTGSQCPGSQSQAPNTPSFWLLCRWSHVETQNVSQFSKKNCLSVCTWSLSHVITVSGGGPVVYALVYTMACVSSIPDRFFFVFFVTCLDDKIGFLCTNKACRKKMNADRLPISISLCAGWVCSSDLQPKLSCSSQSDGSFCGQERHFMVPI